MTRKQGEVPGADRKKRERNMSGCTLDAHALAAVPPDRINARTRGAYEYQLDKERKQPSEHVTEEALAEVLRWMAHRPTTTRTNKGGRRAGKQNKNKSQHQAVGWRALSLFLPTTGGAERGGGGGGVGGSMERRE